MNVNVSVKEFFYYLRVMDRLVLVYRDMYVHSLELYRIVDGNYLFIVIIVNGLDD